MVATGDMAGFAHMGSILNLFSNKFNSLWLVQKHRCKNCIILYSSAAVPLMTGTLLIIVTN